MRIIKVLPDGLVVWSTAPPAPPEIPPWMERLTKEKNMFDVYGSQIRFNDINVATLNDVDATTMHEFIVALHAAVEPVEVKCIRCNAEQNVDMICGACQAAAEQDAEDATASTCGPSPEEGPASTR